MSAETKVKQFSHFVKETMARLTGDTDKAIAEKNARLAISTASGQIAALEGKIVQDEIAVEQAEENLKEKTYPTEVIKSTSEYWSKLVFAYEKVEAAKANLQATKDSLEFAKKFLKQNGF